MGKPFGNRKSLTRRAVLSGPLAIPFVAVTAASATGADPDTELLALIDEHGRLEDTLCAAINAREDAEFAARDEFPKRPPILLQHISKLDANREFVATYVPKTREMIEGSRALDIRMDWHNRPAWRVRYENEIAALDAYEADCARIEAQHGVPRLKAAESTMEQELDTVLRRIYAMPAQTAQGVFRKLLLADEYERFRERAEDDRSSLVAPSLVTSAITDLERMAGGAA